MHLVQHSYDDLIKKRDSGEENWYLPRPTKRYAFVTAGRDVLVEKGYRLFLIKPTRCILIRGSPIGNHRGLPRTFIRLYQKKRGEQYPTEIEMSAQLRAVQSGQSSASTALKSSAKPAAASPAAPGANASAATPLKITAKSAPPLPDLEVKKESKFIYADLDAFEKT